MDKRGERNDSPGFQEGRQPYLVPVGKSHSYAPGCSMLTLRKWPHPPGPPPSCCLPCLFRLQTLQGHRVPMLLVVTWHKQQVPEMKQQLKKCQAQQHLMAQLLQQGGQETLRGRACCEFWACIYRPRAGSGSNASSHALYQLHAGLGRCFTCMLSF